jgi:hypothetical protein
MRPLLFGGVAAAVLGGLTAAFVIFGQLNTSRPASASRAGAAASPAVVPATPGAAGAEPTTTGQQPPKPAGPPQSVVSFTAPASLRCDKGQALAFVNLSWKTSNAAAVSISIDGPAKFADGGPSGSTALPFGCADAQHTYILTTDGASGPAATRTVIVKRA